MLLPTALMTRMDREDLLRLLRAERQQLHEEGLDLSEKEEIPGLGATPQVLVDQYVHLFSAPLRADFPYVEPSILEEIHRARPDGPRAARLNIDPAALYDRIHGGWLGRVAGCMLGKPVESWGLKGTIVEYLKLAGCYPLKNYIPRLNPFPVEFFLNPSATGTFLDEIHGAPQDDDTDYTVLGLHLMETYGLAIKTSDVATEWLDHLAYTRTWTAERAVYRNLILGVPAEQAASLLNPEREYIGARIRADIYGLACPGKPEQAAALAYEDAALSHTKNGIYSTMFMAAMIAWSFVTASVEEIIRVGLSEIPRDCRLAEAIHEVLALRSEVDDWESAYEHLLPKQAALHPVHAINNTVWLVLALLYGNGDFEKTICTAVMCGFDTDCNGANAGTLLGVLTGAKNLPRKWSDPLEDTLHTAVAGYGEMQISALARRTTVLAEKILPIV
jgi:ADP-ribosylglycohydrolase